VKVEQKAPWSVLTHLHLFPLRRCTLNTRIVCPIWLLSIGEHSLEDMIRDMPLLYRDIVIFGDWLMSVSSFEAVLT